MIAFRETTTPSAPIARVETDVVTRMAEAMREMRGAGQTVDIEALRLRDFTDAEITDHANAARNKAIGMMIRRVS